MTTDRYRSVSKTLAKDSVFKKITGVCAGIARHFNVPRIVVRLLALILLVKLPTLTLVAYLTASVILPTRSH